MLQRNNHESNVPHRQGLATSALRSVVAERMVRLRRGPSSPMLGMGLG